jgi:hypothetical protein
MFKKLILLILLFISVVSVTLNLMKQKKIDKSLDNVNNLEKFKIIVSDTLYIFNNEQKFLLIYFSPECESCEFEINSILSDSILRINYPLFITDLELFENNKNKIDSIFLKYNYNLYGYDLNRDFKYFTFPSCFIYSNKMLQYKYSGEISAKIILKHIL